ncbi:hypothetical protein C7S14_0301 [Burkholderia cepacia]|nr:hypothetical protein C7S14_0301 [Burkholderia cepacia]
MGAERKDHAGNMSPYVAVRRGRRHSGDARRSHALVDWSRAGSRWRVGISGGKCVAACRDEGGRWRATRHGPMDKPARQASTVVTGRKPILRTVCDGGRFPSCFGEAGSGRVWRTSCAQPHAFNSRDVARHGARADRPANVSPHVAATRFRAALDTFRPARPPSAFTRSRCRQPCPARHARDRRERHTHSSYLETARHV